MTARTTRNLSDRHEKWLAQLFGGKQMKGSGNQFNGPTDVRTQAGEYQVALDGKATLSRGISVTRAMWEKVVEQAGAKIPVLPLRFYDNERLTSSLDLAVIETTTLAHLIEDANAYHELVVQCGGPCG